MSKRSRRNRQASGQRQAASDSFQNFATRTGYGADNLTSASEYGFTPISRNRVQIEFCYRSSWIAGQAVDTFAEDMTRERIELKGDIPPEEIDIIHREADRLQVWKSLCETIKWARLYGGAVGVLMIDGQDVSTPLRLDTITEGQFKGILPLDRWVVQPTLTDLVKDLGPDLGKPRFYEVIADSQALINEKIHHSRVIRMDGVDLPYWQRIAENGWGQSVLERLWDRLIAFDSATQGSAQLVYKAHLRTYKVEGLRDIIAAGGPAMEGLVKQIEMIRKYQSNEGLTLMDASDSFETHQYAFSGLSDMMLSFGEQISGALGIPLVRLFGQSPAGLNSTGESDIRNYYDNVAQEQERRLRNGVGLVYQLLYRSKVGKAPSDSFDFDFRPLWQLTETEKSTIATQTTTAVVGASDAGLINRQTALRELRQSSRITGVFSNITDEDIAEAENDPPPLMSEEPDIHEDPDAGPSEEEPGTSPGEKGGTGLRAAA